MKQRRGVIALDVGGTKTACGLIMPDGSLLFETTVPTVQDSAAASVRRIADLVDEALGSCPRDLTPVAAGIVIPGWVHHESRTVWAPNIAGWDRIPLQSMLERHIRMPLVLDSDRTGYVKGEAWLGIARGLSDVVFLAVGTGIGAGILSGGRLLHGHDDLAGAVGWMALHPDFQPSYGRMGCFEAEASGASLARKGCNIPSLERDEEQATRHVTAREVIRAAAAGDTTANAVVDGAVRYIAMAVANLVSVLNPEMVVLGGGVFQSARLLLPRVRAEFVRWAQPFAAEKVRVELSSLGERAGLYGAARIALDHA